MKRQPVIIDVTPHKVVISDKPSIRRSPAVLFTHWLEWVALILLLISSLSVAIDAIANLFNGGAA
ncbi:MAG: hypothetical protein R3E93_15925 [Thiothrix sp.]